MARSFGLVDYKVREAEYFLGQINKSADEVDFSGVQFCTSAFVAAARSITFAMQSSLNGNAEFEKWYLSHQQGLRNDPLAKFFNDFRRVTQHVGESLVDSGRYRGGKALYFFVACPDLPKVPEQDVLSACRIYYINILELVYSCYHELAHVINGQWYFTQENFASLGKNIEDAEEELGLPRGWSNLGKSEAEPYRWEILRRYAGSCEIQEQFETWLGKIVPSPEPLPPYSF